MASTAVYGFARVPSFAIAQIVYVCESAPVNEAVTVTSVPPVKAFAPEGKVTTVEFPDVVERLTPVDGETLQPTVLSPALVGVVDKVNPVEFPTDRVCFAGELVILDNDGMVESLDTPENLLKVSPTYQRMVYLQELEKEVEGGGN